MTSTILAAGESINNFVNVIFNHGTGIQPFNVDQNQMTQAILVDSAAYMSLVIVKH